MFLERMLGNAEVLQPQDSTKASIGEDIDANAHGNIQISSNLGQDISHEAWFEGGQNILKGGVNGGQSGATRQIDEWPSWNSE